MAAPLGRISFFAPGRRPADILLLAGSAWCAAALAISAGAVLGVLPWAHPAGTLAWHAHELVFGAVGAVIAGFLLSAVPNWVGRPPVGGVALLSLVVLWLAGRGAMITSAKLPPMAVAAVDVLFPVALALVLIAEVRLGAGRRDVKIAALVAVFAMADIGFHAEVALRGAPDAALRAAIAIVMALIMVIGGRMIPAFTADHLARSGAPSRPAPYGPVDSAGLVVAAAALALWVVLPALPLTAAALVAAGATQALRLARWRGWLVRGSPLLLVLHVAYAFVAAGFLLLGFGLATSGVHAWTAGAMGLMMLGVMARAALGHAGRPIAAGPSLAVILVLAFIAAAARVAAPVAGRFEGALLLVSAAGWIAAFGGFSFWLALCLRHRPRPVQT
jgi:uncharacterized protein involved in response to NO